MKTTDLQAKTVKELEDLLRDWRTEYQDARFKVSNKQLKNFRQLAVIRKNIARVQTLLRAKSEVATPVKE